MGIDRKRNEPGSGRQDIKIKRPLIGTIFWFGIVVILPLLRGILKPFWLSYPPIGEVKQWWPLEYVVIMYPLLVACILWINGVWYFQTESLSREKILFSIRIFIYLFIAQCVFLAVRLFLIWYDNPVGKYLLWSPNSYYLIKLWEYARPFAVHVLAGITFGVFFWSLFKLTAGRVMERNEVLLGVLIGLIFGMERTLIIVVSAFAITVFWFIIQIIRHRQVIALRVTPGFFIASYLVLLLHWKILPQG
jgi:hypothetical protein